jgi:methyl-accepting chemotaxis protein
MKFFHTLRFKLSLIMIVLLLVPLAIVGAISYKQTELFEYAVIQKSDMEKISPKYKEIFFEYESFLEELVKMDEMQFQTFSFPNDQSDEFSNMPLNNDPKKTAFYQKYLSEHSHEKEYTLNLYFASEEKGEFYLSNIPPNEVNLNEFDPRQREWYINAKQAKGEIVWAAPYIDTGTGKSTITLSKAFTDKSGKVLGVMGLDFDMYELSLLIRKSILNTILIIAGLSIIIGLAIVYIFMKRFNKNIVTIQEGFSKVSRGDITIENISVKSKDEISQLTDSFNTMIGNFKTLISSVVESSQHLAASTEQLHANADEASKATEQISSSIEEVSAGTKDQVIKVSQSKEYVSRISKDIEEISIRAERVSESSRETSKQAEDGLIVVKKAIEQMERINQNTDEIAAIIHELNGKSEQIENILTIISGIADQTNLLALNAAIEAARAGEHGKGFAVVADEVRKLAEQSSHSTKQISLLINDIQESTRFAVESINKGELAVKDGTNYVNDGGRSFNEISESVIETANKMREVLLSIDQIKQSTIYLIESMNSVNDSTKQASSYTQEVVSATEEQSASIQEVSDATKALSEMAQVLLESASKFKI